MNTDFQLCQTELGILYEEVVKNVRKVTNNPKNTLYRHGTSTLDTPTGATKSKDLRTLALFPVGCLVAAPDVFSCSDIG
jgi:hypothetical protein